MCVSVGLLQQTESRARSENAVILLAVSDKDTIVSYFESKMTPVVGWICLCNRQIQRKGQEEQGREREGGRERSRRMARSVAGTDECVLGLPPLPKHPREATLLAFFL